MNTIEKIVNELCPNGVDYRKLNSIAEIYDGTHTTPKYVDSGVKFVSVENINNPYLSDKYITKEDYEKYKIKPQKNDVFMTRIGSIGVCYVIDREEPLAYYVSLALIRPDEQVINSRFLKYAIESVEGQKELYKRTLVNAVPIKVNKEDIGKILIPVPPLEIQCKIVEIIEKFTVLTAKLTTELTAELIARKKQHEYYLHELLINNSLSVPMELSTVGPVRMCKRILKAQTSNDGDIPFYKIGTFGKTADAFIDIDTFEKLKAKYSYPKKGEILISAAGTIGRTVIFDGEPAYFQDSNIVWIENDESKVLNKYLYYCYQLSPWKSSDGGTISRLYNDDIRKAKIHVPSIVEQMRIITILDKFDSLIRSISEGLRAEISARQKQYEYYRDKLMTFKRA